MGEGEGDGEGGMGGGWGKGVEPKIGLKTEQNLSKDSGVGLKYGYCRQCDRVNIDDRVEIDEWSEERRRKACGLMSSGGGRKGSLYT